MNAPASFTSRQLLFKELFVGTLIYAVVLGFFDDHTSIVEARSFTDLFLAAIVLEVLTCAAFAVKDTIVGHLRGRDSRRAILLMAIGVWFVMFASKFVFIWAIDLVFGNDVDINGFFGIFVVALVVTVVHRLADWVFVVLGRSSKPDRLIVEDPERPNERRARTTVTQRTGVSSLPEGAGHPDAAGPASGDGFSSVRGGEVPRE